MGKKAKVLLPSKTGSGSVKQDIQSQDGIGYTVVENQNYNIYGIESISIRIMTNTGDNFDLIFVYVPSCRIR